MSKEVKLDIETYLKVKNDLLEHVGKPTNIVLGLDEESSSETVIISEYWQTEYGSVTLMHKRDKTHLSDGFDVCELYEIQFPAVTNVLPISIISDDSDIQVIEKPLQADPIEKLINLTDFKRMIIHKKGAGETLPWSELYFSNRMLEEHLEQSHDQASRAKKDIENHVSFLIAEKILRNNLRVLDIACGPGLYAEAIQKQNLETVYFGIDSAPSAIHYALKNFSVKDYAFKLGDLLTCDFPASIDLAVVFYEVLNFFSEEDVNRLLNKMSKSLNSGGQLFLELVNKVFDEEYDKEWKIINNGGLFFNEPYLELIEEGKINDSLFGHRHIILLLNSRVCYEYRNFLQEYTLSKIIKIAGNYNLHFKKAWGDFNGLPYTTSSPRLLICLEKNI
ncbi:class I SAM-dependent methyltransferase [Paenibacillus paeoniae]|uniref:Class I SAM-dependent methyltransferase n=1 Tax=Paenibacillus paeoniae TaxID=2292705 RepID=A0A371P6N9_9BACL|nr:class I SAM-dependent methyltransferase [Paenibacillus paeoniae]REK71611.1 class I SAM-dependent methyltransferase [Paenibacillus paeoniae]